MSVKVNLRQKIAEVAWLIMGIGLGISMATGDYTNYGWGICIYAFLTAFKYALPKEIEFEFHIKENK